MIIKYPTFFTSFLVNTKSRVSGICWFISVCLLNIQLYHLKTYLWFTIKNRYFIYTQSLVFFFFLFSSSIFVMHFQKCVFRNINNCFNVVAVSNDCLWSNLYSATLFFGAAIHWALWCYMCIHYLETWQWSTG